MDKYLALPGNSMDQAINEWRASAKYSLPREEMPPNQRVPTKVKGDDGDEEQQADERRKIVTWAKRQGYQVVTQLVGQVSPRGWH